MSEGINRVTLLGNLGADPELKVTTGSSVLKIRLATTESFKKQDGSRGERTDWHQVVVWGRQGESLARLLSKGERVLVEGRLSTRSYDAADGSKRYQTEVVATNVVLCGARGERAAEPAAESNYGDLDQPYAGQF